MNKHTLLMRTSVGRLNWVWRRAALLPMLVLVVGLAGCKTTTTTTTSLPDVRHSGPPPVAESEADQLRRRVELRMQLATGYMQQGKPQVALEEINQAVLINPTSVEAYGLRGLIYMQLDDAGLAEDSFRRALSLGPRDANIRHNYGWLLCQQKRYADAGQQFAAALAVPNYQESAKTWMTQGVCQMQAGDRVAAENSLTRAYDIDKDNPVTTFNLALLLYQHKDYARAQSYIRRVNNGQAANAESLWLGVKTEHQLGDRTAMTQLGTQLKRRFPQSREAIAFERGNFDD